MKKIILGVLVMVAGCQKKDRLTSSEQSFSITPPAATMLRNEEITLNAHTAGSSDVTPTWEVSPTTIGTLSPAVGQTVVFKPTELGDAVITATYDGIQAAAQIAVVASLPTSNVFNVYTDAGLPVGAGITSEIFVGGLSLSELSSGYTVEGIRYQHSTGSQNDFWGVTLDKNNTGQTLNLSDYSFGSLKFWIRLGRPLTAGEEVRVVIDDDTPGEGRANSLTVDFINELSTDWQEVTIPIASFAPSQNLGQIKVPFSFVLLNLGSSLTFDIDAIRWEK